MNFNLLVTFLDGTNREVSGIAADLVAFEAEFDLSVTRLNQDMKITHLLWLLRKSAGVGGTTQSPPRLGSGLRLLMVLRLAPQKNSRAWG